MRILVTGAGGFIGRTLTRLLCSGEAGQVSELLLTDLLAPEVADPAPWIRSRAADISDPAVVAELFGKDWDGIVHLAATLTLDAEQDVGAAFATNVEPVRLGLETLRRLGRVPRLVFTSSLAVFGGALPDEVGDDHVQAPTTTYGAHKSIVETLLRDYSRHGYVDGRILRLPIVLVRPGAATPTISDRISALVRDRVLGRDVVFPLAGSDRFPVASCLRVARSLATLLMAPPDAMAAGRAMNLPALTTSADEIVASVERVTGDEVAGDEVAGDRRLGHVTLAPEPRVRDVVAGWPTHFVSERAAALGLRPEASFDEIVAGHLSSTTT